MNSYKKTNEVIKKTRLKFFIFIRPKLLLRAFFGYLKLKISSRPFFVKRTAFYDYNTRFDCQGVNGRQKTPCNRLYILDLMRTARNGKIL